MKLTDDQVKFDFALSTNVFNNIAEREKAFDEWLIEHDRQLLEKAWDEGHRAGGANTRSLDSKQMIARIVVNPYRKEAE